MIDVTVPTEGSQTGHSHTLVIRNRTNVELHSQSVLFGSYNFSIVIIAFYGGVWIILLRLQDVYQNHCLSFCPSSLSFCPSFSVSGLCSEANF